MTRAEAAAYVAARYGAYLKAASRPGSDTATGLAGALDDALRTLGYAAADIPTAAPTDPEAEEDLRVQAVYRAMQQIVRDLGATQFDVATGGDSFKLSQLRAAAEKDLAAAEAAVLLRFGTVGPVTDATTFLTLDLGFLEPTADQVVERYG